MSKYFKFNDKEQRIIKVDNFHCSRSYRTLQGHYCAEVVLEKDEKHILDYEDKEVMEKDAARLVRFLNKKDDLS